MRKDIQKDVTDITSNIESLNEEHLSYLKEDVRGNNNKVKKLLEKDLPE